MDVCVRVHDVPTKQHKQTASELSQRSHTWPWWGRLWRWGLSGRSFPAPEKHRKLRGNTDHRHVVCYLDGHIEGFARELL